MTKCTLYSIIRAVIIALVLVFGFKYYSKKQFEKNVSKITESMYLAGYIAENTTSEYSNIWRRAIKSHYIMVDGEEKYFSDFSEAVNYKVTKFEEAGVLNRMDSLMNVSQHILKKIDGAFFAPKEAKKTIKTLYLDISEYCSLANSPTGSLQSFNNKTNELSESVSRGIKELNIYLP